MMRRARSSAVPSYAREGAAGAAEASAWAIGSSENRLLASQSPSISEKTAPGILMGERLDGKTWTTRERLSSPRLALSRTLSVRGVDVQ